MSEMNRSRKLLPIVVVLTATTLLALYLAFSVGPLAFLLRPFYGFREFGPGQERVPLDIELFYTIKTVVTTVNATLAILLAVIYLDIYLKTRSDFTVGLVVFSMVIFLYAITSNPLLQLIFGFRAIGLGPFAMLPDIFACVALLVLLYLSLKY